MAAHGRPLPHRHEHHHWHRARKRELVLYVIGALLAISSTVGLMILLYQLPVLWRTLTGHH